MAGKKAGDGMTMQNLDYTRTRANRDPNRGERRNVAFTVETPTTRGTARRISGGNKRKG